MLRLATWIGRRLDVNCTGVGKALIAFLPEDEFDQQFKTKALARHNENTTVSTSKLKRELERVRSLGYALDDEEDEIGFRCVGAPVFNYTRKIVAAISVAGTTAQIADGDLGQLAITVKRTASEISCQLGYIREES